MKSKMLLILLSSLLFSTGVTELTSKNYEEEIKEGIVVVEYWAHWNSEYIVKPITELTNAKVCRVNICDNIDLQIRDYILAVPTIIFFENGKEYKRIEADFFELKTTKEELQKIIDDRLMINQEKKDGEEIR